MSAQQKRPAITGISHMCVYSSNSAASDNFYVHVVGATKGTDPQDPKGTRYYFSANQFVEVLPLPAESGIGTRVELMEFQPVIQPCCSAFTAESPSN
jgi:hypothetical protein